MRDLLEALRQAARNLNLRLLIIPPALVGLCVLVCLWPPAAEHLQNDLEVVAPCLVALVAAVYAIRWIKGRRLVHGMLSLLAVAMTLREVHDTPGLEFMSKGIYMCLAAFGVAWALLWRRLDADLRADWRHASWLAASFAAYFLAVLIARRAFRAIPGEHAMHRSLEECAETVAHLMLLATSLLARQPEARAADAGQGQPSLAQAASVSPDSPA